VNNKKGSLREDIRPQAENPKTAQIALERIGAQSGRQQTDPELQVQLLLPAVQKGMPTRFLFLS
jgi:hypothetical protein